MRLTASALAFVLAWAPLGAGEYDLTMMNGEIVHCEVLKETDTQVTIRRAVIQRGKRSVVEVQLPREQVVRRESVEPLAKQYSIRAKECPDTVLDQSILAAWCAERCLVDEATVHALKALKQDSTARQPRQVMHDLGYLEVKGQWVIEEEYLTANNLERWGEKIIPAAEAAQRRALQKAIDARDKLIAQITDIQDAQALAEPKALAAQEKKVAEAERAAATAAKDQERLANQIKAATERINRLAASKNTNNNSNNGNSNNRKSLDDQISREKEQIADFQKQQTAAVTKERDSKRLVDTEKRKLEKAKKAADGAKELPGLTKQLEKARAEVHQLSQGLSDLPPSIKEPANAPKPPEPAAPAKSATGGASAPGDPAPAPTGAGRL
ncbi:hypothetical protein LBMAG53_03270 [Planctomycetota bacterium]|nr:hypothetical protein LBMAG53_03270 [Planctomycetota bacterium]